jgi:hypothetical protein
MTIVGRLQPLRTPGKQLIEVICGNIIINSNRNRIMLRYDLESNLWNIVNIDTLPIQDVDPPCEVVTIGRGVNTRLFDGYNVYGIPEDLTEGWTSIVCYNNVTEEFWVVDPRGNVVFPDGESIPIRPSYEYSSTRIT